MRYRTSFAKTAAVIALLFLGACTPAATATLTARPTRPPTLTPAPTAITVVEQPTETPRRQESPTTQTEPTTAPDSNPSENGDPVVQSTEMIPLMDMVSGENYLGFEGGLYPGGTNEIPAEHYAEGLERAAGLQPLDVNGNPSPNGKIVLLVGGLSNTQLEACSGGQIPSTCKPNTFLSRASNDPEVDHGSLFIFNGARGSVVADDMIGTDQYIYEWIDAGFANNGLSRMQVQAVWLKQANLRPKVSLPSPQSDAYELMGHLGNIVRTLKEQYPNLQMVFISSRIYAGYTSYGLNPEPYAYESGFAVKWLIEAQIEQMASGGTQVNPIAGDLNYDSGAPWLGWGPYLWANGSQPRSDGLIWMPEDFSPGDLTHPAESGIAKVGQLLMDFFKNSHLTRCWFLANGTCGGN